MTVNTFLVRYRLKNVVYPRFLFEICRKQEINIKKPYLLDAADYLISWTNKLKERLALQPQLAVSHELLVTVKLLLWRKTD